MELTSIFMLLPLIVFLFFFLPISSFLSILLLATHVTIANDALTQQVHLGHVYKKAIDK